jgi:ATP-dependent Clp protease ATP-binding subunit ClpB
MKSILYRGNQLEARGLLEKYKRELQDPLAFKILSGEFDEGDSILVERGPEGLTFSVERLILIKSMWQQLSLIMMALL